MKKILASVLTLLLLLMPLHAFAESAAVVNEDELFELTAPDTFQIITENNIGMHQEYLAEKEIDAETLIKNFKDQGIVACGYTADRKQELFVAVTADKNSRNVFSLGRLTKDELDAQITGFMNPDNEEYGIYSDSAEYIQLGDIDFLRGSYENREDDENIFRVVQYYTLQNGRYYMVSLYDYSGAEFDSLRQELDGIMQGFHFTKLLQPDAERQTKQDFSNLIPILIMAVLVLGIIIAVIFMRRSDKKRWKKA